MSRNSNYRGITNYLKKNYRKLYVKKDDRNVNESLESLLSDDHRKICKSFGCGKQLSATEFLYSDYCFKHQQLINQQKK